MDRNAAVIAMWKALETAKDEIAFVEDGNVTPDALGTLIVSLGRAQGEAARARNYILLER